MGIPASEVEKRFSRVHPVHHAIVAAGNPHHPLRGQIRRRTDVHSGAAQTSGHSDIADIQYILESQGLLKATVSVQTGLQRRRASPVAAC